MTTPGQRLTSRDIARFAQVSQATVSRVLNGKGNVAPETRERVLEVLAEFDYTPNESARSLITRRSNVIGIVLERLRDPFHSELIDELTTTVDRAGYRMLLWPADEGTGTEQQLRALRGGMVDGIMFTAATLQSKVVGDLVRKGVPIVLVNRVLARPQSDEVTLDNVAAGRMAAQHLLGLGHRRIAVVGGGESTSTQRDRCRGLVAAFQEGGLAEGDYFVVPGAHDYQSGYEAAATIVHSRPDVTAVVGVSDIIAIGAINAAKALGREVGPGMGIIGFDDIAMSSWPLVELTTVSPRGGQSLASAGIDKLLQRIADPSRPPRRVTIQPQLTVRSSTVPSG